MQIDWISRPNLPSLGLDLAEFGAMGGCQFRGRTSDDRPLSARYRMGSLTVMLEEPDEVLLEEHIGPALHGDMLPQQLCDLTGMTIRGEKPALPAGVLAEGPFLDWSGATTYWQPQVMLTPAGAEALERAFSKARSSFQARLSMRSRRPVAAGLQPLAMRTDREISLAGVTSGTLFVSLPTDDLQARADFEALASRHLFNQVEIVDLADGLVTETREQGVYSRDLVKWCAARPDRYIYIYDTRDPVRSLGVRPARSLKPPALVWPLGHT